MGGLGFLNTLIRVSLLLEAVRAVEFVLVVYDRYRPAPRWVSHQFRAHNSGQSHKGRHHPTKRNERKFNYNLVTSVVWAMSLLENSYVQHAVHIGVRSPRRTSAQHSLPSHRAICQTILISRTGFASCCLDRCLCLGAVHLRCRSREQTAPSAINSTERNPLLVCNMAHTLYTIYTCCYNATGHGSVPAKALTTHALQTPLHSSTTRYLQSTCSYIAMPRLFTIGL